jgi:hypothetical protein
VLSATAPVRAPRWLATGAFVLAVSLAGLAGCSNGGDASAEGTTTTRPASATTDPKYGLTPAELVAALAADDADVDKGEERRTVAQGEPQYEQEPETLGYCSYRLINEASRIQRTQVQLVDGNEVRATIDAALYTPGRATSALRELRSGEVQCGDGLVPPLRWESEAAPSTWSTKDLAESMTGGLTDDHWAKTITRTEAGGDPEVRTVIAQRRGDAIVVVSSPDPARALALAASAGQRLAETDSYLIED